MTLVFFYDLSRLNEKKLNQNISEINTNRVFAMLITVTFPINGFTGSHYEPINVILSQLPCRSEFSGHPTTRHSPSIGSLSKPGLHSHSKDPWLS